MSHNCDALWSGRKISGLFSLQISQCRDLASTRCPPLQVAVQNLSIINHSLAMRPLCFMQTFDFPMKGGCIPNHADVKLHSSLILSSTSVLLSLCSRQGEFGPDLLTWTMKWFLKVSELFKIIFKSAKTSFPRQWCSETYRMPWTFSAWIRNCNRWTQRAFLILAINKCTCSQWQMQFIFSLYRDISLVFLNNFVKLPALRRKHRGKSSCSCTASRPRALPSSPAGSDQRVADRPPCFIPLPAYDHILIT